MKRFVLVIIFVLTLSSIASKNVVSGEIVVETARTKLGARYVYGAIGPNVFDCSGFVQWCFMQHGISLPRTSSQQSNIGVTVDNNFDSLRVGDIVCFNRHVGIYIGIDNNKHRFIHASTSNGVMISALEDKYWSSRYKGARRLTRVQYVSDDGTNSKNITELSSAPIAPKTDIALPPSEGTYELSTSPKPASRFWKNKIKRKDRKTVILKDKKIRNRNYEDKDKIFLICFLFSSVNVFAQWTEQMYNYYSFENYTNYKQFNDAIEPTTFDANLLEAAIFYETNRQRVRNGIHILHYDYALNVAAHNHSVDMVKYNFFSHTSVVTGKIKLVDRINQVGYYNMMCGENIVYSPIKESYAKTAQYLVADLWMNSQGHKENILNKGYTHLGCGIAVYYQDSWVYVKATQNFLRK